MSTNKFIVAESHARVLAAIGDRVESSDEMSALLSDTLRHGLSLLARIGCTLLESQTLLAEALSQQLANRQATSRYHDSLSLALHALSAAPASPLSGRNFSV